MRFARARAARAPFLSGFRGRRGRNWQIGIAARVVTEVEVLVQPLKIKGEADGLANSGILEAIPPVIESPGENYGRVFCSNSLLDDLTRLHGIELVTLRPESC